MNFTPEPSKTSMFSTVTAENWLLATIGLIFMGLCLWIIPGNFNLGINGIMFGGLCFALAVRIILRKLRLQKLAQSPSPSQLQATLAALVAAGVPIRPSRVRMAMLIVVLLVVGTVLVVFPIEDNKLVLACGLLIAITGLALLIGRVTGLLTRAYIQLDPAGLTLGYYGGKAMVPWSAILTVDHTEINSNQAVYFRVVHKAVTAEPAAYLANVHKKMASSMRWFRADFVIMSSHFGIDAPVLAAAITKYKTSPEARQELKAALPLTRSGDRDIDIDSDGRK